MERDSLSSTDRKPPFSFYPPLYVTPPQQRPPSPSSFSPSPYVLNYKRRNPVQNGIGAEDTVGHHTNGVQQNVVSHKAANKNDKQHLEGSNPISISELKIGKFTEHSLKASNDNLLVDENSGLASAGEKWSGGEAAKASEQHTENEVFEIEIVPRDRIENNHLSEFPPRSDSGQVESMRTEKWSGKEANGDYRKDQSLRVSSDGSHLACSTSSLTSEEFFDAPDAPFDAPDSTSDDDTCLSISTTRRSHINSGETMILRLQEEVARRIQAEKALVSMQLQWNEMARRYSLIGLSLLSAPCQFSAFENGQEQADPLELFSEKLLIARFVARAVASAAVRAVKEEELDSIVTAKNREISRLRDKVQYYELVNHEMSQRNQEVIEISQRRRRIRRKRLRWALGCLGTAFGIGTTGLLCYKLFPWEPARNGQSQ